MSATHSEFDIGVTATYITDYSEFAHVTELPAEAAVAWVKQVCPDVIMGYRVRAADLTLGVSTDTDADKNGWLNKLFIIVGLEHNRWLALYNHDGVFSLYASR